MGKIYVYRPERIVGGEILGREFTLDETSIRTEAELVTIGNHGETRVNVYQLPTCIFEFRFHEFSDYIVVKASLLFQQGVRLLV